MRSVFTNPIFGACAKAATGPRVDAAKTVAVIIFFKPFKINSVIFVLSFDQNAKRLRSETGTDSELNLLQVIIYLFVQRYTVAKF